jgi:hypothetical protein
MDMEWSPGALPARPVGCILPRERRPLVIALMALVAVVAVGAPTPAQASAEAVKAFDDYVAKAEERIGREESSIETFVSGMIKARAGALDRGEVVVDQRGEATTEVPGGLIHHWMGTVFIPGATVGDVLAVVQDYGHLAKYYAPEVVSSRLISRQGDDFRIALRTKDRRVITVVLDSEYAVHYGRLDGAHQFGWSRSTRVTEIADAGGARERALSEAESHGYLWRLNSYWRFLEASGGVVVECEAISLTRTVPVGLGWLIGRYLREIPRASLGQTLGATRDAAMARASLEHSEQEHR